MINVPLRILLVEDVETDVELIKYHLSKIIEQPVIKVTDNVDDCSRYMQEFLPDVVISDYNLPTCTGMEILEICKSIDSTVPFIFLTGTLEDEELAAQTILTGAGGFILKKHMDNLDEKLRPYFKKIVFNMGETREDIRYEIRKNNIIVNKVHNYLNLVKQDLDHKRENIEKAKDTIKKNNFDNTGKTKDGDAGTT